MSDDLVSFEPQGLDAWAEARGEGPHVLVHSLRGFIDAGHTGGAFVQHVLDLSEPIPVARFDIDRLLDYRSRRPDMVFSVNEWTEYEEPFLRIDLVRDVRGKAFLLLNGAEPDLQWEGYVRSVRAVGDRLGIGLVVGVHGIPMAAPHTRPLLATVHGSRPDLVPAAPSFFGTVTIPASASNLLEYRFGRWGLDALTIAVHVPHYLSPSTYPPAAQKAMEILIELTGLDLGPGSLDGAAHGTWEEIEQQVSQSEEIREVVASLERQYDEFLQSRQHGALFIDGRLPTADELGAEFEKYLADRGKSMP